MATWRTRLLVWPSFCLRFQNHVHTYRILPDEEGNLAVQTNQGVQAVRFQTLADLVSTYQQPNQGLVTPLLFPVETEKEKDSPDDRDYSDGEDEKPPLPPRTVSSTLLPFASVTSVSETSRAIANIFLQRWLDSDCATGGGFALSVAEYLRNGLPLDVETSRGGQTTLVHLESFLTTCTRSLSSEVDKLKKQLDSLLNIFCPYEPQSPAKTAIQEGDPGISSVCTKLYVLSDQLGSTECKMLKSLKDITGVPIPNQPSAQGLGLSTPQAISAVPFTSAHRVRLIPIQSFDVKVDGSLAELTKIGKPQKMVFKVDVEGGKMAILKRPKDTPEESNVFSHKRILQLIKSQRTPSKLGILFDKEKERNQRRDFVFETPRKREAFCQLMQQMKNRHSEQGEPDLISIFIGTWNMGSSPSPRHIHSWLTSKGLGRTRDETTTSVPHDVYVLGSQENSLGEREWAEQVRCSLREITGLDFRTVASHGLWNMKLLVLVKSEHENRISHVNTSCVKTGLANTLGNKGAVGASFLFGGTSLGFVNSHLTSGNEKTSRRNQNYLDILRFLSLGDKRLNSFDITSRFTHLFWFGDLNYRLDMDVQEIIAHVSKKEFEPLLKVDQLNLEREKNKVFLRFNEEEIAFPPTYRYERGTRDSYAWQKFKTTGVRVNVPSWCDRILWKSYPETHLICSSYGCTDDIVSSDHSPVFATFEVGVTSQFVSKKVSVEESYIKFESVEAIVKTNSRTKFFLEFYSSCLEGSCKSAENDTQQSEVINFLKLGWSDLQLPTLKPMISDLEYLQDQHLLLSIKSMDGFESYGECCIALKSMIGSTSQQFETFLSHRGEETGNVRGWMKVQVPMDRLATRERLYDWISIDTEDNVISKGKQPVKVQEMGVRESQPSFITGARPTVLSTSNPCTDAVAGIKVREKERDTEWDKDRDGERWRDLSEKPSTAGAVVQPSSEDSHVYDEPVVPRTKTPNGEGAPAKNCFDNPSYFIIEGFPAPTAGSMAAIPECPSSPAWETGRKGSVRAAADGPLISPHPSVAQQHSQFFNSKSRPGLAMARVVGSESDNRPQYLHDDSISQEDCSSPNRPPPDYPPPPLPNVGRLWPGDGKSRPVVLYDRVSEVGALEEQGIGIKVLGKCHEKERKNADASWKEDEAAVENKQIKEQGGSNGSESDTQCVLGLVTDRLLSGPGVEPRRKYQAATQLSVPPAEDHSWFALQMAKSLCDGEYSFVSSDASVESSATSSHPPLHAKGRVSAQEEKCFGLRAGSSNSPSSHSERTRVRQCGTAHVRRWLSTLGLETYTNMLVENGWDDLEYLGDLTKDDLNEIGVLEPSHQRLLLDNLPNIAE
uniref:phosphatidylinositol-3,4,5-trisphosphate 5-phosphatase n=1 Tax=Eptatretus burgeri TaxID=7764 RepID=A0A8C4R8Z8_EPTBU